MKICDVPELMELFWPQFIAIDGGVFIKGKVPNTSPALEKNLNLAEASYNHRHILDFFEHGADLAEEPFWDNSHPDFRTAVELGPRIARIWATKLEHDFPKERFRIYYCEHDNPIVRFHKVRRDLPNWLEEDDCRDAIADGSIVILETPGSGNSRE